MTIKFEPTYIHIEAIRDICEPWIAMWAGDEWGKSMWNLHGAAHISYGLTDEDCATVAEILYRNILAYQEFNGVGGPYGQTEEEIKDTQTKAREARDYWLKGGNLGDWNNGPERCKKLIDQMPNWLFGEE